MAFDKHTTPIVEFIKAHDQFLLSAHINADGDAIASVIATKILLSKLGKKSTMILHDQRVDNRFKYLAECEQIRFFSEVMVDSNKELFGGAILLDVPSYSRLGDVSKILPDKEKIIKVDHHPFEDDMGGIEWIDERASSTAAMVFEIAEKAGVELDEPLATAIYTGIVYDTGRFSFSNTTARDMFICSKLIEAGVKPSDITNRLFFENSFKALKTIGKGLYSLENYLNGAVNVIYLSLEDMNQSDHGEIEELANYSVAIRGGEVGLFVREVEADFHKISFRSKGRVDVNKVAKAFGGGGHARAAGCRITGKKKDILQPVIDEISKQLS